jgi:uncharacterized protein (DUF1778 family)
MARTGRPKLEPGRKRADLLSVRLQPEERGLLEAAALRKGLRLSEWAREALLRAARAGVEEGAEAGGIEPPSGD